MKTQRLAQLPWTETLSVDIVYHAQALEKEAALSGIHSTCSSTQHRELYQAIIEGHAEQAREVSSRHILYVQEVLEEVRQEVQRMARAERRKGM